jgi:hypothetical protein
MCDIPIPPRRFKIRHAVNLHKALTGVVVAAMMWFSGTTHAAAWLYLGLHGSYGISWLIKDVAYPDRSWQQEATLGSVVFTFLAMTVYWVAPALLMFQGPAPPQWAMGLAVAMFGLGMQAHHASDAQKYAALEHGADLIDDGMFAGKSLDRLKKDLQLEEYSDLKMYEEGREMNIEGAYEMLRDDDYMSRRPEVPEPDDDE